MVLTDAPFTRGLAWYRYKGLEDEFVSATKYFPFQKEHKDIWSEFFSDLLTKTCSSIDSFFKNMLRDKESCCPYPYIQQLQAKLDASGRKPDIHFFRKCFEPLYALSTAEVDIAYGLTFYDSKFCPFEKFGNNKIPAWWTAYNNVKHTWFECVEEATLESVIGALAGLFLLNVLNTTSRIYLLKNQNVIKWDYMTNEPETPIIRMMQESKKGIPKTWAGYNFTASTPVFIHVYRVDESVSSNKVV